MSVTLYHGSKSGIVGPISPSSRSTCDFGLADMLSRAKSQQCRLLARVFERAGKCGYDGRRFVDGFMASQVSADFCSAYDRLQWLGAGYLFDEATDALGLAPDEAIARLKEEAR